jgi:NDP-sugar pyrophosphorylase family protein
MQIIIPMSGFGERFRRAGYAVPKPLVEIDGKPIIAHVIDMFPGETDFIFICNRDHLNEPAYRMREILEHYCPTGRIVSIDPHKLGPIHAVTLAADLFDMDAPTIVNYCDFTCYWDWAHFCKFAKHSKCDGAIPAYKGFHPHTLGTTNYAYMREQNGWVLDIQEKQPYTDNRMEEYASSGTYYFSSARLMLEAFAATKSQDLNVGGEYYVSLAYKPLLAADKSIAVYPLQHFMQWGTPEDVAEYRGWSELFRRYLHREEPVKPAGSVIVPMAGLGQRFAREGYTLTKPLIPVSGQPMVAQAIHDLPKAESYTFVLRSDMSGFADISKTLAETYTGAVIKTVSEVTDGQACTALLGLDEAVHVLKSVPEPITFGACDNGALYNHEKLAALFADQETDVIVWVVRGHANAIRHPQMYGWVDEEDGLIKSVSVKVPLSSPATDPIVLGTFTFKSTETFRRCVDRMIARDGRVNGEFYLDTCINDALELGMCCKIFEVDHYISWGTPNDLRTFEYWQSCFHKWAGHPYRLEHDPRIPATEVAALDQHFAKMVPELKTPRR